MDEKIKKSQVRKLNKLADKLLMVVSPDKAIQEKILSIRSELGGLLETSKTELARPYRMLEGTINQTLKVRGLLESHMSLLGQREAAWSTLVGEEKADQIIRSFVAQNPSMSITGRDNIEIRIPVPDFELEYRGAKASFEGYGVRIRIPSGARAEVKIYAKGKGHKGPSARLHPHSDQNGKMCQGEAAGPLREATARKDFVSIYQIVSAWLRTYNHFGSYDYVERFSDRSGQRCAYHKCCWWHEKEYWDKRVSRLSMARISCPRCYRPFCKSCSKERMRERRQESLFCPYCYKTYMKTYLHQIPQARLGLLCRSCLSGVIGHYICTTCGGRGCNHLIKMCLCGSHVCRDCKTEIDKYWCCPECAEKTQKNNERARNESER